ncbi:unnamed protein product [Nezara viridula]|uniref:Uncharacterized protein n=1 Tax=Nezara viridula TaxID=85310 RepID=A0A9P0EB67_NEZVI|nr:unnamed protein product [Nezara viridula]
MEEELFKKKFEDLSEEEKTEHPLLFIDDNNTLSNEDYNEEEKLKCDEGDCKYDKVKAIEGAFDELSNARQKSDNGPNQMSGTFGDSVGENIEKLFEENLSLIKANTSISMEEEISDIIEISDNESSKLDEADSVRDYKNSFEAIAEVYSISSDVPETKERRSEGLQVRWEKTQSLVIPNHSTPNIGEEMPHSNTGDKSGVEKNYGARARPSRLSMFLNERNELSADRTKYTSEDYNKITVKRNLSQVGSKLLHSNDDPDEIKKIESDDEENKFDEAVGGSVDGQYRSQKSARKVKGKSLLKSQVRWGSAKFLTPDPSASKLKSKCQSASDSKQDKKNKEGKTKKSRFSCFIRCFKPKNIHNDENDPDDHDDAHNITSMPRAAIRGLISGRY